MTEEFNLQDWTEQVKEALTRYERDHATHRASRDYLVRLWHDGLKAVIRQDMRERSTQVDEVLERVTDSMNLFLKRSKL